MNDATVSALNRALSKLGVHELTEEEQAALDQYIEGKLPASAMTIPYAVP